MHAPTPSLARSVESKKDIDTPENQVIALPSETHEATALPIEPRTADLLRMEVAMLSPSERSALPPLRISMHVFHEDPSRRFAIVDTQRLREGDVLAPGLRLRSIERDGLELDWQGRALWLPR